MLGNFVRQLDDEPRVSEGSNQLLEAIQDGWTEERKAIPVTLAEKKKKWDEWWIYASSIERVCPRMYALGAVAGLPDSIFKAETLWLFDQGHAYHDLFQQKIMAALPPEVVLGSWERDRKMKRNSVLGQPRYIREQEYGLDNLEPIKGVVAERGFVPRPKGKGWRYVEPKFRMPSHRVVVKPDVVFQWPGLPLEVCDFKTEKLQAKDQLNPALGRGPRDKHIRQLHVEMWATGATRGRIVYIIKGEISMSQSILEHVVHRDEQIINEIRKETLECVEAVKWAEGVTTGEEMDRLMQVNEKYPRVLPECHYKSKGKPKYCAGRDLCFMKGIK